MEENLFRVRIARHLDIHRSIAGDEPFADRPAGHYTAEAMPRYNFTLEPFRKSHWRDLYSRRLI